MKFIRSFTPLAAALILSCPLQAASVRVLPWDGEIAAMRLALADSKGSSTIQAMHPSKRTRIYQVTAGEKPIVIEALDRKGPDGKPFASEVKIPEGMKNPLIVILPDTKAPAGVRPFVLEDDVSNFSWGSTRFINATGREVVYVAEKKGLALPSSWTPVQSNPGGDTRNIDVKFFFKDETARAFYSAVWEYNKDLRMLVFLVPSDDPRLGPVAMKMIPEDRRLIEAESGANKEATGQQP
jgi:hypothetical protein